MATLITGASSGIGYAFAQAWFEKSDCLLLVSQNQNRLLAAKKKLILSNKNFQTKIETFNVDLSQSDAVEKIYNFVDKKKLIIDTLINNAGVGYIGDFSKIGIKKIKEIINLNMLSLTKLTYEMIHRISCNPSLIKKEAIIINIASIVGFLPIPMMAVYAASKSYVVSFSQALSYELKNSNLPIRVIAVCPGTTKTSFFKRAGIGDFLLKDKNVMEVEEVVNYTLLFINKKKSIIIPGFLNKILVFILRFSPRILLLKISYNLFLKRL
jgi:short-subunit dehydrogenase